MDKSIQHNGKYISARSMRTTLWALEHNEKKNRCCYCLLCVPFYAIPLRRSSFSVVRSRFTRFQTNIHLFVAAVGCESVSSLAVCFVCIHFRLRCALCLRAYTTLWLLMTIADDGGKFPWPINTITTTAVVAAATTSQSRHYSSYCERCWLSHTMCQYRVWISFSSRCLLIQKQIMGSRKKCTERASERANEWTSSDLATKRSQRENAETQNSSDRHSNDSNVFWMSFWVCF